MKWMSDKNVTGSFRKEDVTLLLKDVTSVVKEGETAKREEEIQNGRHYSEDLPIEVLPSLEYMEVYQKLFEENYKKVALYTSILTRLVLIEYKNPVFVSLVRAGVPCGILMRRYAGTFLGRDIAHYGISIIRGKGFDENALLTILAQNPGSTLIFVDGWTGKGMIQSQLIESCESFNQKHGTHISPILAVLSDPAGCTPLYAVREDFINPSCCLNSTVCGLISRTVLNSLFIGNNDYHGVRVYNEFEKMDVTNAYLDGIYASFSAFAAQSEKEANRLHAQVRTVSWQGMEAVKKIAENFSISDINRIKPSIGETTRVLLRRVPHKILVKDKGNEALGHIMFLAKEKGVPVEEYTDMPYLCCGLIENKKRMRL